MEEAVSGVKGELAVKLYGDDLRTLEKKAEEIQAQMATVKGIEDLGIFRIIGQPNLNYTVDRDAAARWGINVADIQDAVQTAVGANALTQVQQGEARFDVTLRYQQLSIVIPPRPLRTSACWLLPASVSPWRNSPRSPPTTAPRRSIVKAVSATSPSSTPCADATWGQPSKKPSVKSTGT